MDQICLGRGLCSPSVLICSMVVVVYCRCSNVNCEKVVKLLCNHLDDRSHDSAMVCALICRGSFTVHRYAMVSTSQHH